MGRDLLTHFDSNDQIIQGFDDINVHVENCSQYIDLLQERFDSPDEDKKGIIKDLLDTQEHWLPSLLIEKGVNFKRTTNKAEDFLGDSKVILDLNSLLQLNYV